LLGIELSQRAAQKAIIAGFAISIFLYMIEWSGFINGALDIYSLCVGILMSTFVLVVSRYKEARVNKRSAIEIVLPGKNNQ
jgi:hypothetical protein